MKITIEVEPKEIAALERELKDGKDTQKIIPDEIKNIVDTVLKM